MIIQQFGSILIKIKNNNPISKSDVFDNIYLIRKKGIDLNYKEKVRPHYYYEPGNSLEIIKAVRNHNNRVDIWNKRHPYEIAEIKVTSDILPYPYPIIIRGITVSDKELFKSLHNDMDIFVKTFNKTILIYFKNKLEIAKNIEVNPSVTEECKVYIQYVNKWFLDKDIHPNETESFLNENQLLFEEKIDSPKDDGIEGNDNSISDNHSKTNDKSIFVNIGDFWEIVYERKESHIKHTKGMDFIAYLLGRENEEFPIILLTQAFSDNTIDDPQGYSRMNKDELEAIGLSTHQSDPMKVYDQQALIEIRKEKRKLNEELSEAERNNDIGKVEELKQKIFDLEEFYMKGTRPGGYAKNVDNPEKREIRRITRLIVTALNRIKNSDENLYLHLKNSIQKGKVFSYKPDRLMDWILI